MNNKIRTMIIAFLAVNLRHGLQVILGILVDRGILQQHSLSGYAVGMIALALAGYLTNVTSATWIKLTHKYEFLNAMGAMPGTPEGVVKTEAKEQLKQEVKELLPSITK